MNDCVILLTEEDKPNGFRYIATTLTKVRSDLAKLLRGVRSVKGACVRKVPSTRREYRVTAPNRTALNIVVQI